MKFGKVGRLRQMAQSGWWLCLLVGCAAGPPPDVTAWQANHSPEPPAANQPYRLGCPDVLEVAIADQPPQRVKINADGRIDLGPLGQVRVEGRSGPDVEHLIADAACRSPKEVRVRVAEYNSQQVYLFGAVHGLQRAVPYRGRETVRELLHRAGGLGDGAKPDDVYVVRSHVADGGRPEVFPIPLEDTGKPAKPDLRLEPFDQIYIGEAHQSTVRRGLPPCLRPLYEALCGMKHTNEPPPSSIHPSPSPGDGAPPPGGGLGLVP
jgi:protein involved in polysaccharide export with SLBB domain